MINKNIKKIYIDFDNVCVNSIKAIVSLYNEDFSAYKKFHNVYWWHINTWKFEECNCAKTKQINTYFNQPRFFERVDFMPGAQEVITELSEYYKPVIVSMGFSPNLKLKKEWLNENLPGIKYSLVNLKKHSDKSHIDMSDGILFDDSTKNLFTSNAIENICFGDLSSWNQEWKGRRCMNWTDVRNYLF